MKVEIREELNDTECMARWYCEGVLGEEALRWEVDERGGLKIELFERGDVIKVSVEKLVRIADMISVEYAGDGWYRCARVVKEAA